MGRRRKSLPGSPGVGAARVIPLREMIRLGCALGLSPEQAMDAARLTAAVRKAEPGHPGFLEDGRKLRTLGHGLTPP
jgi:hypothetical protein